MKLEFFCFRIPSSTAFFFRWFKLGSFCLTAIRASPSLALFTHFFSSCLTNFLVILILFLKKTKSILSIHLSLQSNKYLSIRHTYVSYDQICHQNYRIFLDIVLCIYKTFSKTLNFSMASRYMLSKLEIMEIFTDCFCFFCFYFYFKPINVI